MDVVEKVARAMREAVIRDDEGEFPRLFDLLDFSGENKAHTVTNELARAAIAAMLEAVGEPVAWKYEDDEVRYVYLDGPQKHLINVGLPETPLYSLSPLTQALAASDPPHNRP